MIGVNLIAGPMPPWLKRTIAVAGLLLMLPGLLGALGDICIILMSVLEGSLDEVGPGLASFTLAVVTTGAGGEVAWHALRSLQGKTSSALCLPSVWALAGISGLCVAMGLFVSENDFVPALLFPPLLLTAAALPPLLAVAWFMGRPAEGLTWRRGMVAFAGGATLGVVASTAGTVSSPDAKAWHRGASNLAWTATSLGRRSTSPAARNRRKPNQTPRR